MRFFLSLGVITFSFFSIGNFSWADTDYRGEAERITAEYEPVTKKAAASSRETRPVNGGEAVRFTFDTNSGANRPPALTQADVWQVYRDITHTEEQHAWRNALSAGWDQSVRPLRMAIGFNPAKLEQAMADAKTERERVRTALNKSPYSPLPPESLNHAWAQAIYENLRKGNLRAVALRAYFSQDPRYARIDKLLRQEAGYAIEKKMREVFADLGPITADNRKEKERRLTRQLYQEIGFDLVAQEGGVDGMIVKQASSDLSQRLVKMVSDKVRSEVDYVVNHGSRLAADLPAENPIPPYNAPYQALQGGLVDPSTHGLEPNPLAPLVEEFNRRLKQPETATTPPGTPR